MQVVGGTVFMATLNVLCSSDDKESESQMLLLIKNIILHLSPACPLPAQVLGAEKHKSLRAALGTVGSEKRQKQILRTALGKAYAYGPRKGAAAGPSRAWIGSQYPTCRCRPQNQDRRTTTQCSRDLTYSIARATRHERESKGRLNSTCRASVRHVTSFCHPISWCQAGA
eukprot:scaffold4044_cov399-Prasinococcus_capsulatus_cf.AAC.9